MLRYLETLTLLSSVLVRSISPLRPWVRRHTPALFPVNIPLFNLTTSYSFCLTSSTISSNSLLFPRLVWPPATSHPFSSICRGWVSLRSWWSSVNLPPGESQCSVPAALWTRAAGKPIEPNLITIWLYFHLGIKSRGNCNKELDRAVNYLVLSCPPRKILLVITIPCFWYQLRIEK